MPLYKLHEGKLNPIRSVPFKLEKEIQRITEDNLDALLGLEFVKSEFELNNFRIDTLAFDKQTNAFVIIEYKKDKNFSVIDQGYAYLSLMLNNKADFILEYNENSNESLRKNDVDWSQSKVLFISQAFTTYQRESINFRDLPIELWEIKKFSNDTLSYNKIKASAANESIKTISKADKQIEEVSGEIEVYTEDKLLEKSTARIKEAFLALKDEINQVDSSIEVKITKSMICFYSDGKGMVWINPLTDKLKIHLRKGNYSDKYNIINPDGWGGYPQLIVSEDNMDIDYLKGLIKQAYNN